MLFTPLHRALGLQPGALTDEMVNEAITAGIAETDDLDWKKPLPEAKSLSGSDMPKDVAAMANSGGGMIVYGVAEDQKRATDRTDVGEVSEAYERTYRSVAISGIHPPVFGLGFYRLGHGTRALAVAVPASVDVPHLVYRGEYFGAPIRNDADTVWMRERQLEGLYRRRLDDRRNAGQRLERDYDDLKRGLRLEDRVWLVGVARPRIVPSGVSPMEQHDARRIIVDASTLGLVLADSQLSHPLASVADNPRPGLRRWVSAPASDSDSQKWKETWASVHFDGSVSLAAAMGGMPTVRGEDAAGNVVNSRRVEWFVADLLALVKTAAQVFNAVDYELYIGVESAGFKEIMITITDGYGSTFYSSRPIQHFIPVESAIQPGGTDASFLEQVRQVALDVVSQAGINTLVTIASPAT
ncbi:AlbA family DNA-binding domain-containing protein [Amycolatopsis sp. H20-H5]|uniref:AlbA family DNA-binding domain-containing protein n=1 Tax=Amycolatopsis sp. H20-H5 TaxID=3046309 RepID=UPI002DBB63A9|nr:ATP-binding protein [Amycolatopsis sp. H20-H5]MEC3977163.1 ATP-binding protein [Amycolatopsis sp. H20-H5]